MDQAAQHKKIIALERYYLKKSKESDERFKKGEWSDAAICSLLDAYEEKWNKRNKGNLRVGDWEEVASHVSSRSDGGKLSKTPTQCKNKIEGMKKKYRSEAESVCTGWPFFPRMDLLLHPPNRIAGIPGGLDAGGQLAVAEPGLQDPVPQMKIANLDRFGLGRDAMFSPDAEIRRDATFSHFQSLQGDHDLQGRAFFPQEENIQDVESNHEDASNTLPQKKDSLSLDSDTTAHACKAADTAGASCKRNAKQRKQIMSEVATSIRTFADSILKLERAKMEMYKDTERLRAAAEARRSELELKRTEAIMNTQLQIAKLLSNKNRKKKKNTARFSCKNERPAADAALVQITAQHMQAFEQAEAMAFPRSTSTKQY